MEENVALQFAETKTASEVLALFGVLASTLAAVGLYGVLAAYVGQRRRELAIRMSMGATPGHLKRIVAMQGARLTLAGIGIGILISAGLARVLQASLPGVAAFSPSAYTAAAVGVCAVSLVSTLVPMRRAGRTDAIVELRRE